MKKSIIFIALIAVMAIASQQLYAQVGVRVNVFPQLFAGTITPAGSTNLCFGGAAGLITGTPATGGQGIYTYQWQSSLNGIVYNNIIGATGQNYDPGNLNVNTWFKRNDTDPCGIVTTNFIAFTVWGQFIPGVTTGGNTGGICNGALGGTLTSTAGSGGAPGTTLQWEVSIDGGIIYTPIPGANALTYITGAVFTTSRFRLAFINPSCGTVYGNVIVITVYNVFAGGTISGGTTPTCWMTNGGILTSTAPTGGAPGTTLQWESSTDGITYADVIGQTGLTYAVGNLPMTMWYRLRYTNTCGVIYSNIINIIVYTTYGAGTITAVGIIPTCYNTDFGFFTGTAATGGAPGTTYQWQQFPNGGAWSNIIGATGLNYDPSALTVTTRFRRQDINTCGTLYTNEILVTVWPIFIPGTIGIDQNICWNDLPAPLIFTTPPSGASGVYTYQWYSSPTPSGPWTIIPGATGPSYQPPSLITGTSYAVIVTSSCGSFPALP